jgi:hypothetical protein
VHKEEKIPTVLLIFLLTVCTVLPVNTKGGKEHGRKM